MNLNADSIRWAIQSLAKLGDTDLFPVPVEFRVLADSTETYVADISAIDISMHQPGPFRRFIVPKDDMSYRAATQLDPLDNVIFTAIVHQFGSLVETRRRPVDEKSVFSYRFSPSPDGDLYDANESWNKFWRSCFDRSNKAQAMLVVDISDFYNQIYHHTIENQLIESKFPNQVTQWILRLLGSASAKSSRGIPIGPHPTHLLAELSMIPVDNSMAATGMIFCRFVDDIVIFADNQSEARICLYRLAEILDKQQRLHLQKSKTKIYNRTEFEKYCETMVEDRPINDLEEKLIHIISKHSKANPYRTIFLSDLSEEELRAISPEVIEKILSDYLAMAQPDFVRLRWLIRRLAQTRHPAGVSFLLSHFDNLMPALSDICHYFASVGAVGGYDYPVIGGELIRILDNEIIQSNEYFQLSILSMFNRAVELDHTSKVLNRYSTSSQELRREIILTAAASGNSDWLRERKEEFKSMAPWTRRAFLYAAKLLPTDERKYFLRHAVTEDFLENIIIKWAKR